MKIIRSEKQKLKRRATILSIVSNSCLIVLKLFAGFISGSMSVISEAIHSSTDLLASFIAYFAVKQSSKPADEDHQFGHGKYEYIASLLESLLIIFAGILIVKDAMSKLYLPSNVHISPEIGLVVMCISILVNFFVSRYMFKIAKMTNSPAVMADGSHLGADMFSSVAVVVGLLMVKITNNVIFDSVIAIIVSLIIIFTGVEIFKSAQENLLDRALTKNQMENIRNIISAFPEVSVKSLRTRQIGVVKNIEIILLVNGEMTINQAHFICDKIEKNIDENLQDTEISIHMEPIPISRSSVVKS